MDVKLIQTTIVIITLSSSATAKASPCLYKTPTTLRQTTFGKWRSLSSFLFYFYKIGAYLWISNNIIIACYNNNKWILSLLSLKPFQCKFHKGNDNILEKMWKEEKWNSNRNGNGEIVGYVDHNCQWVVCVPWRHNLATLVV